VSLTIREALVRGQRAGECISYHCRHPIPHTPSKYEVIKYYVID